jgi:hypothetical protein
MKYSIIITAILLGSFKIMFSQSVPALDFSSGFDAMSNMEQLPLLHQFGTETKQFISFDVSGGNIDYEFEKSFTKYIDDNGESVIFDEIGPGCLYRQQMNVWCHFINNDLVPREGWGNGRIKYYFDFESNPSINLTLDEFFRCHKAPFNTPLCFFDSTLYKGKEIHRFAIMYYPFAFSKRLKITITKPCEQQNLGATWYQYTYLAYPKDQKIKTWKGISEDSEKVRNQWQNLGKDPKNSVGNTKIARTFTIPKGKQKTVLELKGKGSIASLKIHLVPFTKETFYNTNIKIFWDNSPASAVNIPLGYLFGGGGKDFDCSKEVWKKTLNTLIFGFDGTKGDFYSYWPMPFWSAVRIVVENNSTEDITDFSFEAETKSSKLLDYPIAGSGHFCAKRTLDNDTKVKPFANAFRETGRGHVVGVSFFSEGYDMDGDEFTYIDGSRTPQIHGDGTEDDHNQGWGGDAYQKPLWGGLINGYQGAYRIYLNDSYVFNSEIAINYEYSDQAKLSNGGKTDVTIFYYKSAKTDIMKKTDQIDVGNSISEIKHSYSIKGKQRYEKLFSAYDGYEKNVEYDSISDDGRSYDGYSQFVVSIDPNNSGVKLRKRLSRLGNGMQTSKVFVDGTEVGIWHIVQSSFAPINQAWLDSDFDIPASYTQGKNSVSLKVEYSDSRPMKEINEYSYQVFCFQKAKE